MSDSSTGEPISIDMMWVQLSRYSALAFVTEGSNSICTVLGTGAPRSGSAWREKRDLIVSQAVNASACVTSNPRMSRRMFFKQRPPLRAHFEWGTVQERVRALQPTAFLRLRPSRVSFILPAHAGL